MFVRIILNTFFWVVIYAYLIVHVMQILTHTFFDSALYESV